MTNIKHHIFAASALLALAACANTVPPRLSDALTATDQERLDAARHYAFHGTLSNQAVWSNVTTGLGGTVRALREFRDPATGQLCRKLVENVRSTAGGNDYRIGTGCQQADGSLIVTFAGEAE